ncbi:MAG: metallophosphoesterase family protein [Anaerolineaceae bacterium]|nr:metallophosphoesterase family protein [Anaerolineaceae bacterium]
MRILIISDIHANLTAFKAVLDHANGRWDTIWFLGDLVGYGPDPNECVQELQKYSHIALSGNHDKAVLGELDIKSFNREAKYAITWTQETISSETRAYLQSLPSKQVEGDFTLAHASPRYPVWEYILDPLTASENFNWFETDFCLVGHTHVPVIFEEQLNGFRRVNVRPPTYSSSSRDAFPLGPERLIINPGSVGQPRDSDPRAAYALLDTEAMTWFYQRVPYPVRDVQERMEKYGMPKRLVNRLAYGV